MRILIVLVVVGCGLLGCGSSKASNDTTTTSTSSSPSASSPTSTTASSPSAPEATGSSPSSAASSSATLPAAAKATGATPAKAGNPIYSCFSYTNKASPTQRFACMRTADCAPYLEQAKQVAGLKEVTGCASVESVWCFHTAPSKVEPDGADVCQPTSDGCKSERASTVRSGGSVDSDCTQQR